MAFRCEDAPCCGCFSDPRGCVDRDITLKCKTCGVGFHPDAYSFGYCLRCEIAKGMKDEDGEGDYEDEGYDDEDGESYDEDGRNEDCGYFGYEGMRED